MSITLKRYKEIEKSVTKDSLVEIRLFGSRVAPSQNGAKKNMLLLSDHGQAEYIKAIYSQANGDNDKFVSALKSECFSEDGELHTDYLNKDLKIIFSISKAKPDYKNIRVKGSTYSPADRIEYLRFYLTLDKNLPLKFTKWNRYSTDYNIINIADMTFTQSSEIGGALGGEAYGMKSEVSGKSKKSMEEKQSIRHRYIVTNGCITDSSIDIIEEGTHEIDLAGNVIADVSLRFEGTPLRVATITNFDSLKKDTTIFSSPRDVKVKFEIVRIPNLTGELPCNITACLNMDYLYRHVVSGYETFSELDDKVIYYNGTSAESVPLFTKADYLPNFYYIGETGEDDSLYETKIVIRDTSFLERYPLFFRDYISAREFLKYLTNNEKLKSDETIKFKNNEYTLMKRTTGLNDTCLTRRMIDCLKLTVLEFSQMKYLESNVDSSTMKFRCPR